MFGANQNQTVQNDPNGLNTTNLNNNPYIAPQDPNAAAGQTAQPVDPVAAQTNVDPQAQNVNAQVPNTAIPALNQQMGFDTNKFLIGLAIGAAGAYLLTNENAQKALFKTFAKGSDLFTAGIEEMKERFEDAKAEMEANED